MLLAHLFEEISVPALHRLIPKALLLDAFACRKSVGAKWTTIQDRLSRLAALEAESRISRRRERRATQSQLGHVNSHPASHAHVDDP